MTKKKDQSEETDIFGVDEESTNLNYTIESKNDETAATMLVQSNDDQTAATKLVSSNEDETAATVRVDAKKSTNDLYNSGTNTNQINKILEQERANEKKVKAEAKKKKKRRKKKTKDGSKKKRSKSLFKMKFRLNTLDKISIVLLLLTAFFVFIHNRFTYINFDWFIY